MADDVQPVSDTSISAPPAWTDVESHPDFQALPSEQKLVTFANWHDAAYNYATQQPEWKDQGPDFNNSAAQKQQELSKAAGGITPEEARIKVATDAVNESKGYAAMAESTRPESAIERDALHNMHPSVVAAYYNNKATPPPSDPNSYFNRVINAPERALNTITGKGTQILSDAVSSVGNVVGQGTGITTLETPFRSASDWLSDVADKLIERGNAHGTTDPIALTLDKVYPGSKISTIYGGISQGTAASLNQFIASENAPFLLTGGAGARTLAGVFTALGIKQLPDLYKQFNAATDPQEKIALATQGIVGIAAPAFGLKGEAGPLKAEAYTELHNHLTQVPVAMLQAALQDPKVIPDLKASIQDALKAKEQIGPEVNPTVQAAQEANAPKTAAEVEPLVKETTPAKPSEAPDIQFRKGKLVAPEGTTRDQFADFYKTIPKEHQTPELIAAIQARLKADRAKAPETIIGPSLAGRVGKPGDTHADLLARDTGGPYAAPALEAFQDDTRHTFRTSKGRDVNRAEAMQLALEHDKNNPTAPILKPGIAEAVKEGTRKAEVQSNDLLPQPEIKAAQRAIPAWMLGEEAPPPSLRETLKGTGPTPEQRAAKNEAGTKTATDNALKQGFVDTHGTLHKLTDAATASKIGPEIAKELAKAYPAEKVPAGGKELPTQHTETGIKYPRVEVPTDREDAKGKPILETRAKFTNNSLQTAAALDDGQPLVIPPELVQADKVNPAINYELDPKTGNYTVTGVRTKYGFVEKPGDLADLYNQHTAATRQKMIGYVYGEKALAAAEGQAAGLETGAGEVHEPERLGEALGEEQIPQGKPEDLLAQQDAEDQARHDHIMEEADRLGISPESIISENDTRAPKDFEAKMVVPKFKNAAPEDITNHLEILKTAGIWKPDGKLSANPIGTYLTWLSKQGAEFPHLIAKEILQNSGLRTGDLKFEIVNDSNAPWAGLYVPKNSGEGRRLGLTGDLIRFNLDSVEEGGTHSTMLHEIIHAVFEPILTNPARFTPELRETWNHILNIGETANKFTFKQVYGHDPTLQEYQDFIRANKTDRQIGKFKPLRASTIQFVIGDTSEIPTRVLTDKDIQEIYSSSPVDPRVPNPKNQYKNLFEQALAFVKSLWPGKKTEPTTLLDQAIDQVVDFIRTAGEARKGLDIRAGPEKAAKRKIAGFDWDKLAEEIAGPEGAAAQEPLGSGWLGKNGEHIPAIGEQEHYEAANRWINQNDPQANIGAASSEVYDYMFKKGFVRIANDEGGTLYIQGDPNQTQLKLLKNQAAEQNLNLVQDLGNKFQTLYSPEAKMSARKSVQEDQGGEIVPVLRRTGLSHELELQPNATLEQLNSLDQQIDSSTASDADKESMKAQLQTARQTKALAQHTAPTGIIGSLKNEVLDGWWNRAKTSVQAAMNKTFPRTTLADQRSGELMARWVSSRTAAPYKSNRFIAHVLEGTDLDSAKFGAALTEDNLRSVKANFQKAGETEKADAVGSIIGQKGSPFKTEEEYQTFLNDSVTKQAIARHIEMWNQIIDPMYKQAMSIDPDVELASRGEQTAARINLFAMKEGEKGGIVASAPGNLRATLQRKSPFGVRAKGTGTYNTNYADMMANTFGRQSEIAAKNEFEKQLVASGNAVIDKTGLRPTLSDGEETSAFPLKTRTLITDKGAIPLNQNLYVRKSLAAEYLRASDAEPKGYGSVVSAVTGSLNKAALAGFTDFTVHASNLFTALTTRPSVSGGLLADTLLSATGRADALVTLGRLIVKSMKDNQDQLGELAEIGALRDYATAGKSKYNPLTWSGKILNWMDKSTRLMLDDAYKGMVDSGLVENSETARREFVNQVGQYNRRAQNRVLRLARDTGIGPFATAGTTFNALGARFASLDPGVKASTNMAATALRVNALSKWAGAFTLVGALNYAIVGKMTGRPGVPIGNVDTGRNDKNGKPLSVPVFDLIGAGRALRVTGLRGGIEAYRKGLTTSDIADSAIRDIYNAQISPFAGPPVRLVGAFANISPFIGVPPVSPKVAPGESQIASNAINAIVQANPVAASIREIRRGAGLMTAIEKQFPRFVPKATQTAEFMAHYPEIVRKAQASAFVDDVIRQARQMEPDERSRFIRDSLNRLNSQDRDHAKKTLKYRRIQY